MQMETSNLIQERGLYEVRLAWIPDTVLPPASALLHSPEVTQAGDTRYRAPSVVTLEASPLATHFLPFSSSEKTPLK